MDLGARGLVQGVGLAAAPSAFLFLRFLAALIFAAILFPKAFRHLSGRTVGGGVLLSLPFYAGFILQVTGLRETSSTVSAFLTSLMVVFTPLLGRLFFRERLSWSLLVGAGISLGGILLLTNPSGGLHWGEMITLASALAFALQIQMTNVITRKHHPEAITLVMFACATLFSGATLLVLRVPAADLARSVGAPHVVWTVLYTALFCSVIAIAVLNRCQREISATRAAVLYLLEPLFAGLFASLFVGEELTARTILGGGIIIMGNLICELVGRRR